jgi:hypothetical protein
MAKNHKELTPEEEVAVLRREVGALQRDINRLLDRIKIQDKALLNRKKESTQYHELADFLLASGKATKEELAKYIIRKKLNKE